MHATKRLAATAAVLAGGLVLGACSSGETPSDETTELSFGHVLAESQPWHTCGAVPFEEEVEASGNDLQVEMFPAGQTHNSTAEQLDALDTGNLDITWGTPAQLATRLPQLDALDAVYAFRDVDHLNAFLDSELADELWEDLREESGLRVIGAGYYGTRHVTANHPVSSPDDLAGVKMRVLDAPLWTDNGTALGAEPTAVPFSELYLGLQQGVVDAQENPLPVIDAQAFDEVQEYASLTGHVVAMMAVVIPESTWSTLSEEQQDTLLAAGETLGQGVTDCTIEQEDDLLDTWSSPDSDFKIHTDVDVEAFRQSAEDNLLPKYEDSWADLYREIQEIS